MSKKNEVSGMSKEFKVFEEEMRREYEKYGFGQDAPKGITYHWGVEHFKSDVKIAIANIVEGACDIIVTHAKKTATTDYNEYSCKTGSELVSAIFKPSFVACVVQFRDKVIRVSKDEKETIVCLNGNLIFRILHFENGTDYKKVAVEREAYKFLVALANEEREFLL
jgi:hypothetical protein